MGSRSKAGTGDASNIPRKGASEGARQVVSATGGCGSWGRSSERGGEGGGFDKTR